MRTLICTCPVNGRWKNTCFTDNSNLFAAAFHLEIGKINSANLFCVFSLSSASNRIIHAKDHASVQLSIVVVDPETGRQTDGTKTYAICGEIRRMGESDDCIVRLAKKDGLITK